MGFADRLKSGMCGSESVESPPADEVATPSRELAMVILKNYRTALSLAKGHRARREVCEWFLAHAIVKVGDDPDAVRRSARLIVYEALTREQPTLFAEAAAAGEPWGDEPTVAVDDDGKIRRA
jgi:hypothetical protein